MTERTIERHLRAAYRKLDVGTREELAAALGERDPANRLVTAAPGDGLGH